MLLVRLAALALVLSSASAQLRPRRVGVSSMGEQEPPEGAADSFEQGMEAGLEALKAMGGMGGDSGDGGMAEMMKAMGGGGDGGMGGLAQMMKAMGGNEQMAGELQQLLSNPEAMQAKMADVFQALNTDEGKAATAKIMEEMQSVLTDPEKMRQGLQQFASNPLLKEGLQQFASNPMLKGLADSMPELKEVLDHPEMIEKKLAEFQEALSAMGDGTNPMDMLKGLNIHSEELAEGMRQARQMLAGIGGAGEGGDAAAMLQQMMAGAGAGEDGHLKARVQEQLRAMMQQQQTAGAGFEEF